MEKSLISFQFFVDKYFIHLLVSLIILLIIWDSVAFIVNMFSYIYVSIIVILVNLGARIMRRLGDVRDGLLVCLCAAFCFGFVYIFLLILRRCYWLLCGCELWGLDPFLKYKLVSMNLLFIPNNIFLF